MSNTELNENLTIDMLIEAERWPDEADLRHLVDTAIASAIESAQLNLPEQAELSIVFSDDNHIRDLNREWRQIDKATNVLSFPTREIKPGEMPELLLGDIILARETIEKESVASGVSFADHLTHLVIHGFLHIFGYDHIEDKDAAVMEQLERESLHKLNIGDPYEDISAKVPERLTIDNHE